MRDLTLVNLNTHLKNSVWRLKTPLNKTCYKQITVALFLCLQLFFSATCSAFAPDFSGLASKEKDDFLPVEQALVFTTERQTNQLSMHWKIASGVSLYKAQVKISADDKQITFSPVTFKQTPTVKDDPTFGIVEVFHDIADGTLQLTGAPTGVTAVKLNVQYQGCADAGLCYPPVKTQVIVPVDLATIKAAPIQPSTAKTTTSAGVSVGKLETGSPLIATTSSVQKNVAAEQHQNQNQAITLNSQNAMPTAPANTTKALPLQADGLAGYLQSASAPLVLFSLLILGVGLTFTPCVYPMIPILLGLITGEKKEALNATKGFKLSLSYVMGMASTYAIIGTLMGYFGARANLQLWLQKPAVLIGFALLFVVLALSMFGLFTIQLPQVLQRKLNTMSNQQRGGRMSVVFVMGVLSALVVSPCVSAPLAGVLVYISATGNALFGGLALFALALGMGIPLLILGTTSGRFLPKAGAWMDAVKGVFGVGLLAVAIWLLSRVFSGAITLFLWALLLGVSSVYMGAFKSNVFGVKLLFKGLGLLSFSYAIMLIVGAVTHQDDPLHPLDGLMQARTAQMTNTANPTAVEFEVVTSPADLLKRLTAASQSGKLAVVEVSAEWCAACKVMEHTTFKDLRVITAFTPLVKLQLDISESSAAQMQWLQANHLYGPPALLFYDKAGQEIATKRIQGEIDADSLLQKIGQ